MSKVRTKMTIATTTAAALPARTSRTFCSFAFIDNLAYRSGIATRSKRSPDSLVDTRRAVAGAELPATSEWRYHLPPHYFYIDLDRRDFLTGQTVQQEVSGNLGERRQLDGVLLTFVDDQLLGFGNPVENGHGAVHGREVVILSHDQHKRAAHLLFQPLQGEILHGPVEFLFVVNPHHVHVVDLE